MLLFMSVTSARPLRLALLESDNQQHEAFNLSAGPEEGKEGKAVNLWVVIDAHEPESLILSPLGPFSRVFSFQQT